MIIKQSTLHSSLGHLVFWRQNAWWLCVLAL